MANLRSQSWQIGDAAMHNGQRSRTAAAAAKTAETEDLDIPASGLTPIVASSDNRPADTIAAEGPGAPAASTSSLQHDPAARATAEAGEASQPAAAPAAEAVRSAPAGPRRIWAPPLPEKNMGVLRYGGVPVEACGLMLLPFPIPFCFRILLNIRPGLHPTAMSYSAVCVYVPMHDGVSFLLAATQLGST